MTHKTVSEKQFKGIWIPADIWTEKKLTLIEKLFFVEINSLDNERGCFAGNAYFSEFFGLTNSRCSQIIKSLEKKGYVSVKLEYRGKVIKKRTVRVCNKLHRGIKNITLPYVENAEESNTSVNNTTTGSAPACGNEVEIPNTIKAANHAACKNALIGLTTNQIERVKTVFDKKMQLKQVKSPTRFFIHLAKAERSGDLIMPDSVKQATPASFRLFSETSDDSVPINTKNSNYQWFISHAKQAEQTVQEFAKSMGLTESLRSCLPNNIPL